VLRHTGCSPRRFQAELVGCICKPGWRQEQARSGPCHTGRQAEGGQEARAAACQDAAVRARRALQAPLRLRRLPQVARDKLVHLGACIGKLTHSGKFRLTVGALDILAQHARYKVGLRARQRAQQGVRGQGSCTPSAWTVTVHGQSP